MKRRNLFLRLSAVAVLLLANVHTAWCVRVNCRMAESETHIYEDARVRLMLVLSAGDGAQLVMENKTDVPLYVNKANSFGYVGDRAFSLFVPGTRTESHSQVYGSIDIDPRFQTGSLRGYGHSDTYTEQERAVLPLAPHGRTVIHAFSDPKTLLDEGVVDVGRQARVLPFNLRGRFIDPQNGSHTKFRRGQVRRYAEAESPLRLAAQVEYSSVDPAAHGSETQAQTFQARVSDYVSEVSVGRNSNLENTYTFRSGGGNAFRGACIGVGSFIVFLTMLMLSR